MTAPWGKRGDMIVHESEPFNAEPTPAALARAVLTSTDAFYVRNHGPVPELDPRTWRLSVRGLIARPLTLSLADLQSQFDHHRVIATMQCAGNGRAGLMAVRAMPGHPWQRGATATATWTGARLADVLTAAGLDTTRGHVAFEAPDIAVDACPPQRFGASIPLAKAMSDEVLLAWRMNGQPLHAVHGAPVRVVVPGYIGARSVKWVDRVTVREHPSLNYFQDVAYRLAGQALGPIAVNSAILAPDDGATVAAGPVTITGYAMAGDGRGITRVEVSLDGGRQWHRAELGSRLSQWAWRQWSITLDLPPGEVEVTARAWDVTAATQPEHEAPLWNPKGYANNAWARTRYLVKAK
ncbi:sulfite oxidase [Kutzneria albida]|uniref:Sulfite oxidase n=1 Tax=Kutzneria albida DSM 43870 TaxID=1449976 RepID=W5WEX5_9PSEU|nr:sulfite oxidase [Kutzneria albida]AHH99315.1 hypothetical protein KALB_5955 [Kutzneria albida DSM 43870]